VNAIGTSPAHLPITSTVSGNEDLQHLAGKKPNELAQEFESLFVSMLVKELRQTSSSDGGLFPGDPSDTFGGMFDMYMGQHLARSGGIGLAESIAESIAKQTGQELPSRSMAATSITAQP
jgi:Rod binding domain-containing protein